MGSATQAVGETGKDVLGLFADIAEKFILLLLMRRDRKALKEVSNSMDSGFLPNRSLSERQSVFLMGQSIGYAKAVAALRKEELQKTDPKQESEQDSLDSKSDPEKEKKELEEQRTKKTKNQEVSSDAPDKKRGIKVEGRIQVGKKEISFRGGIRNAVEKPGGYNDRAKNARSRSKENVKAPKSKGVAK